MEPIRMKGMLRDGLAPKSPPSPGATYSPQLPGATPDHSTIPGEFVNPVPPAVRPVVRPLSEYGTAQQIMNLIPVQDEPAKPEDFEQPPAAFQESRKAYPWKLPPVRPTLGFALDQGTVDEPPQLPDGQLESLPAESEIEG